MSVDIPVYYKPRSKLTFLYSTKDTLTACVVCLVGLDRKFRLREVQPKYIERGEIILAKKDKCRRIRIIIHTKQKMKATRIPRRAVLVLKVLL
jgi:hypothetical protein